MLPLVVLADSPMPAPLPSSSGATVLAAQAAPVKPFSLPPLPVLEMLSSASLVAPLAPASPLFGS
jgi:hypothetical protein